MDGLPVCAPSADGERVDRAGAKGISRDRGGPTAASYPLPRLTGHVEGAIVKRSISFHAAAVMTPEASQALIRAKAKAAMVTLHDLRVHEACFAGPTRRSEIGLERLHLPRHRV